MNLTVMISGSCDYLSCTVVHFAFEISSHSTLWTFRNITWTHICY